MTASSELCDIVGSLGVVMGHFLRIYRSGLSVGSLVMGDRRLPSSLEDDVFRSMNQRFSRLSILPLFIVRLLRKGKLGWHHVWTKPIIS
jgi:hypothetical protein